jgi:hypothetical protein
MIGDTTPNVSDHELRKCGNHRLFGPNAYVNDFDVGCNACLKWIN